MPTNCLFATTASVSNTSGPTAIATTVVNASCGASNGSITLGAVTGGLAPYTYSVDGSAFTAAISYTNLAAGSHAVEVRDANSCLFATTATITDAAGPTAIATTVVNAACGASNGSITLGAVTGGLAPYTYSVDGSAFSATLVYPGLAAGTYAVEVRDANNCLFATTASVSNTSGPTAIATTVVNASCGASNGSITLGAVTGGLAPYTYSVDGSAFTAAISYTNLAAGSHAVEVRDANSCLFATTATITDAAGPTAIATTVVNAACGASNGSITLGAVTGGLAPYTYSVDGSAFSATLVYPGLAAGTYAVEVRDANNCLFATTASVSNTSGPTAIATTVVNASCGASNGSITLGAVTGGLAPYTYSVDGSAFTAAISYTNLAAGSHAVEVRDANSCLFATTATITDAAGPTAIATTVVNAACGASNGSITLGAVTGGLAPYTYSVDGSAFSATLVYPGFAAGTYAVEVRDANNCLFATTASITSTAIPATPITALIQPTCTVSTGTITITAPTEAGMTYSIDGVTYANSDGIFNSLAPNTYAVTARNTDGCISTATSVTINSQPITPVTPDVAVTQPTCTLGSGTLTVTVQIPGETYSFDNGATFQSGNTLSGLAPGTYSVIIKSTGGCNSAAASATIDAQPVSPAIPVETTDCTAGPDFASVTVTSPS